MYDFDKSHGEKTADVISNTGPLHDVPEYLFQGSGASEYLEKLVYPQAAELGTSAMPPTEAVPEAAPGTSAMPNEIDQTLKVWDGLGGLLGVAGGAYQMLGGAEKMSKGGENNIIDGGLDVVGGGAGAFSGGTSLLSALGVLGDGSAAVAAGPALATIGTMVAGDHQGEAMGLFGTDADGKPQGAAEAALNESAKLDEATSDALGGGLVGTLGGGLVGGAALMGLGTGAAVADFGLGYEALGASSGLFGTGTSADGSTHNMGAFEALDHAGQAAGNGVDDLLGLDHDSTGGAIVGTSARLLVDGLGSTAAVAGDLAGGIVGGAEAAYSYLGDCF